MILKREEKQKKTKKTEFLNKRIVKVFYSQIKF